MKNLTHILLLMVLLPLLVQCQTGLGKFAIAGALTTEQLTNQAEVVALGKVSTLKSEWNAARTRIVTRVTIAVHEFLKGGGGEQQLTILTPGGEIGEVGELYCGSARFKPEEEVVVFAKKAQGQEMQVAGGAMGKVTVERDKATQVMMASPGMTLDNLRLKIKTAAQARTPEEK
jgi:hypothetical protein